MNIDEITKEAVSKQIAASVIEKLTPEHRDIILCKAVEDALTSYSYRSAVEEAVCKEAARIASEVLSNPAWQLVLRNNIESQIKRCANIISDGIPEAMLQAFAGNEDDRYKRGPGLLHAIAAKKMR